MVTSPSNHKVNKKKYHYAASLRISKPTKYIFICRACQWYSVVYCYKPNSPILHLAGINFACGLNRGKGGDMEYCTCLVPGLRGDGWAYISPHRLAAIPLGCPMKQWWLYNNISWLIQTGLNVKNYGFTLRTTRRLCISKYL